MIRPRWRKVISDLWKNKTRSVLVIASIAVGLYAIGIITKTYLAIDHDMQSGFQSINPANIQVQTSLLNDDTVERIRNLDGVEWVEAARKLRLQVETSPGNWVAMDLKAKDYEEAQIGQVELLEGTWPPGDHQIVLAAHKLNDLNAGLGDWLSLKNTQSDTFQVQIVGIVRDQTIGTESGTGGYFNAPLQGYVTVETAEWLGLNQPELYSQLEITLREDAAVESYRQAMADDVRQALEEDNVSVTSLSTRSSTHHPNLELVDAISVILLLLGFLIVFLSAFLITNTLQALLDQQIQQVGIMKTVGARRTQVMQVYMTLVLIFGLLAFALAAPLADRTADYLMRFLAVQVNFRYSGARFEPAVLAIQVALALIVPQVAAFLPILQGTRISVREALSGIRQAEAGEAGWLDQQLVRLRRVSRQWSLALRNVFRNKGRLVLTLITLSLGGAVFISVFNVRVSLSNYVAQLSQYFLADLNVSLARPYRVSEVERTLYALPEVDYVEAWSGARASVVRADGSLGENINMIAVPNDSRLIDPILLSGRWLLPGDQNAIVLNDQFQAQFPGLQIGDTLKLQIGDQDSEWVVVGFFQLAGKIGGLAAYINLDYLETLPGQVQGQATTFRVVAEGHPDSAAQKVLASQVEALLEANNFQISDLSTGSRVNDSSAAGFAVLTNFLLVLAILTALVGSIGLTGTMSMNVMDRTREIGVMRSIGASDPILMSMVLAEGLVIGWLSWLIGALLAFPISRLMSDLVTQALFGVPSNYGFTITGFLLWLGLVSALAVLASAVPARSAARLTIREVLAYE